MITEFLEYLREVEPLPEGIELEVKMVDTKFLPNTGLGDKVLALFETTRGSTKAVLTVATKSRSKRSMLSGIGHEYYHAVQWFRDGLFVPFAVDNIPAYIEYEAEAEGFGYRMAVGYC